MKLNRLLGATAVAAVIAPGVAFAGELPLIAPPPAWLAPTPPIDLLKLKTQKLALPFYDQQVMVDKDLVVAYEDAALLVSNEAALTKLGTVSLAWQPQHGDLTFHSAEILRGDVRIDLLKGGSALTVLRRETDLDKAMITGELTAVLQATGLRVGDVLHFTYSKSTRDSALGGHVQSALLLIPRPVTMQFGRSRVIWPQNQKVVWKSLAPGLDPAPVVKPIGGGMTELTLTLPIAKLPERPKNIPGRLEPLPVIEVSSFTGWEDVSRTMAPLYKTDGAIAEGSDLAKLVDAIKARSSDPLVRSAEALRVVQDDVRYLLVALGNGNYVPQRPTETWSQRSGDCKAKTLLLLAMLRRMGITAEPVLANGNAGDLVSARLPSAQAFDHVFVRADVAGESLWLDGTRLGDRLADIRDVPRYGNVLPVRDAGAGLVKLPTRADARSARDIVIALDNSAGLTLPAPFSMRIAFTGRRAAERHAQDGSGSDEALEKFVKETAKGQLDTSTINSFKSTYDTDTATWAVDVTGVAYPDWKFTDGRWTLELPSRVAIEFDPDRTKSAWNDLPALIPDPWTATSRFKLTLPMARSDVTLEGADPVTVAVPAVSYQRSMAKTGLVVTNDEVSKETGAEVAATDIGAARKVISAANDHKLRVIAPPAAPQRWDEIRLATGTAPLARLRALFDARIAADPKDAERVSDRAWFAKRLFDWPGAEADYGRAITLDPTAGRYVDRYWTRRSRGDLAGAQRDAQAAFDLEPDGEAARSAQAQALGDAGKIDAALELLEADPDPATDAGQSAIDTRAKLLADAGRGTEVLKLLDTAIARKPNSSTFVNDRCFLRGLLKLGLDAAMADCDTAIKLLSNSATGLESRGLVHLRAGRLKEARSDFDAALAIDPETEYSRFLRAIVASRQGDQATATADLEIARKLFPYLDAYFAKFDLKP